MTSGRVAAPRISVCLAAYNGRDVIVEQLESILGQLGPGDEVIVVNDCSTDDTVSVVESLRDRRITVITNSVNSGHVKTFENALGAASGEFVFLSDQDDVWAPGRVQLMCSALEGGARLVAGNYETFGEGSPTQTSTLSAEDSGRSVRNIAGIFAGRVPYFGSCMAMTCDFARRVLPFPRDTESHDLWLAIAGNVDGAVTHLDEVVTFRRVHETNLTPRSRRPLSKAAMSRVRFAGHVALAVATRG